MGTCADCGNPINRPFSKNKPNMVRCMKCLIEAERTKLAVEHANQKAQAVGAIGELTPAEWQKVKKLAHYACLGCGAVDKHHGGTITLSLDHIAPFARGGSNVIANI